MADINVRSDSVDVEQIMRQIRARIREKRGADYTEAELHQLAKVKLEKFLDPRGVRSDLVEQFRTQRTASPAPPNYQFEQGTLFETHRGALRSLRHLLRPILKLFFNPDRITAALHIQSNVNTQSEQRLRRLEEREPLTYELIHNLTVELTRLGIDVHNLKMRVESLSSRLDFDERRARSLEGVVQYRPAAPRHAASTESTAAGPEQSGLPSRQEPGPGAGADSSGAGSGRRRRRRRRRRPGQTMAGEQANSAMRSPEAQQDSEPAGSATTSRSVASDTFEISGGPDSPDGADGPDSQDQ